MKTFGFLLASLLAVLNCRAVVVFSDNFNRADSSTVGNGWTETSTGTGNAEIASSQLQIDNGGTAGRTYISQDTTTFGAGYASQLDQNSGTVTWTFNMHTTRTTELSGFGSGSYGIAFVLATSSSDFLTGSGYAVVWGQNPGTDPDPLRLVRYTAGLVVAGSTITDVITGSGSPFGDMSTEFLSVRVTYNPSDDMWSLAARDDAGSFADPSSGSLTALGTAADSTYTAGSLDYMGALWNYNTTAGQSADFDNLLIDVIPEPGFYGAAGAAFLLGVAALHAFRRRNQNAKAGTAP